MVNYSCPKCNKVFNRKSTYVNHTENKKYPCDNSNLNVPPKPTEAPPKPTNLKDLLLKEPKPNINNCICMYCEKTFARPDSLQRHLNGRCKSKENYDELEKLKEDMKILFENYKNLQNNYQKIENNYQNLENENVNLKNEINEIKIIQKGGDKNNETQIINNTNNTNNKQINKGVIVNNTQNINIVQFGEENINDIDILEAMKIFFNSTGANIVSNIIHYLNLNLKYPQNNNICITDISREIVKMHNGKKFVYKKFKNVKDEILNKAVKNTRKIVKKYEDDENIKKTEDRKKKIKINETSLKLIEGISGETIVREEVNEKEKQLKIKNNAENVKNNVKNVKKNVKNYKKYNVLDDETESEEERDFTLEERLRIEHLDKKMQGLQDKTFENIKEELYNAKELIINVN